ncbi:MAG: hypothetical protein JXC85_03785 [Candidatus Aenigmarchaeota archaeon]|nr:hypothetical protein [Candidatus Aenigmarchaeota archaeon]
MLSLIGGILILITGVVFAAMGTIIAAIASIIPMFGMEVLMAAGAMMYIPLILGIVVIVGAALMKTGGMAKMGSILVLICSIASLVTVVGSGFFIGAILGIIGGALGLKG